MAESEQSISLAGMPLYDVDPEESEEPLPRDQADSGDEWDTDLEECGKDGLWDNRGFLWHTRNACS